MFQIIGIGIGFVLLIKGADFLVEGASKIAKKLRVSEMMIGLTIVSVGTSMPELFVSTTSALKGYSDISIGNVIGSNICNLLLILGVSAIIQSVPIKKQTIRVDLPISILFVVLFYVLCNRGLEISRQDGIVLIVLFLFFLVYLIISEKKSALLNPLMEIEKNKKINLWKNILITITGIAMLKIGGDLVIFYSEMIATEFLISEKVIGLTIVALGTSLPELVTSIAAAKRKESDIAIGNIIGSNIFNILMIIGITAVIQPIRYNISYNKQVLFLILGMILVMFFSFIKPKEKVSRWKGFILFFVYIVYILNLIIE